MHIFNAGGSARWSSVPFMKKREHRSDKQAPKKSRREKEIQRRRYGTLKSNWWHWLQKFSLSWCPIWQLVQSN